MATFNPELPASPIHPGSGWGSKSSEKPLVNESKSILFKGLGNDLEAVSHEADNLVKKDLEGKAQTKGEELMDTNIAQLEGTLDTIRGHDIGTQHQSLLPKEDDIPIPPGLKDLPKFVENLQAARANGKYSPTQFDGAVYTATKQLRNQYQDPRLRAYIDKQFEAATGIKGANAYARSLLGDINSWAAAGKEQHNKTLTMLDKEIQEGNQNAVPIKDAFMKGTKNDNEVMGLIAGWNKNKYDYQQKKVQYESETLDKESSERSGTDLLRLKATTTVHDYFNTWTAGGGLDTPAKMMQTAQKLISGEIPGGDEMGEKLGATMMQTATILQNKVKQDLATVRGKDGKSLQTTLGSKFDTEIAEHFKPMHDTAQMLLNKDWGKGFAATRQIKAAGADRGQELLSKDSSLREDLLNMTALQHMGGNQAAANYFTQSLGRNLPENISAWQRQHELRGLTQPGLDPTRTGQQGAGKTATLFEDVKSAQAAGIKQPQVYSDLIGLVDTITNKEFKPDAKINAAIYAFDEKNHGLISQIQPDYKDDQGNVIPGQYATYTRMVNPAVTNNMVKLQKSNDKGFRVFNQYRNFAENEFTNLYDSSLKELAQVNQSSNMTVRYSHIKGQDPKFIVERPDSWPTMGKGNTPRDFGQAAVRSDQDREYEKAKFTVNNINSGLRSIASVYKATGEDVDGLLLRRMHTAAPGSITEGMINSLVASQGSKGDSQSKSNYDLEPQTPSLDKWLKKPDVSFTKPVSKDKSQAPKGDPTKKAMEKVNADRNQ